MVILTAGARRSAARNRVSARLRRPALCGGGESLDTFDAKRIIVAAALMTLVGLVVIWVLLAPSLGQDAGRAVIEKRAAAAASASTAPTETPERTEAEGRASLAGFLAYVARFRSTPNRIENGNLVCETHGADAGFCDDFYRLPDATDTMVAFIYMKRAPAAVRFTVHVPTRVTCAQMGATSNLEWARDLHRAGGRTCSFLLGPLKSLRALVEDNIGQHGELETGVHVFSEAFRKANANFREGLEEDEARGR